MTKRKRRSPAHSLLSLLLCVLMVLGLTTVAASAAKWETEEIERLSVEFKNVRRNKEFVRDIDGPSVGLFYLGDHEMMITEKEAIDVISARIHYASMLWWGVNWVDDSFRINADLRFYETEETRLMFLLATEDPKTEEGTNGWMFRVETIDGKPCLINRDEEMVYTFDYNTDYTVELQFVRGATVYDILVNGEMVSDNANFISPLSSINMFRWDFNVGDVMFDNFHIYGVGRKFPAPASMQAVGEMPEIDYPAPYEKTGEYRVYHNTVRQDIAQDDIFVDDTNAYLTAEKAISILDPEVKYDGAAHTITAGETVVDITDKVVTQNDREMLSLASLNEIFGAKVWLDREECMIFLSTDSFINDNFLRACDYKFVMNGEPYYELSFNKFDMSVNLLDYFFGGEVATEVPAAEEQSLKTLSENGFTSIRVFINNPWVINVESIRSEEGKATYYKCMDYMLDLCDKYGIRVIASLQLESDLFVARELVDGAWQNTTGEIGPDIMATPDSESRKFVYSYLDEFVGRYKDRDTILMWEISNEMSLDIDVRSAGVPSISALQLGDFYADITEYINNMDPNHLVDSGDAGMRGCQYSMLEDTLAGVPVSWRVDTPEEHNMVLYIINHGINVISAHASESVEYFENYMNCSRAWNKPFYLGETGDLPEGEGLTVMSPESLVDQKAHLDKLLELGIQLASWWDFDAPLSNELYKNEWNVTLETTPDLFYAIAETNQKLKEKWIVNGVTVSDEKTPETALLSAKYAPVDTGDVGTGEAGGDAEGGNTGIIIAVIAAVVVIGAGATVVLTKKKKG